MWVIIKAMNENRKYHNFGGQLKKIRLDANKTINDVSGAVELPVDRLRQIELGEVRPQEELIFLLASYFNLSFPKTQHLLHLAGYNKKLVNDSKGFESLFSNLSARKSQDSQHILVAFSELSDERAMYINETSVNVSSSGVVIEFLQSATINRDKRAKTIAKVGMSIEHAHQLRNILRDALSNMKPPREQN